MRVTPSMTRHHSVPVLPVVVAIVATIGGLPGPRFDNLRSGIRQGFIYERAPHITLKSIANNSEIDVIWEDFQTRLESLRKKLNAALGESWEEWQIPRKTGQNWSDDVKAIHTAWWEQRIVRQREIDDSIAKAADVEFLYDRPYEDKSRVRVAGPFTVESLSPHRVVPADEEELLDVQNAAAGKRRRSKFVTPPTDFAAMVLEHLRSAGVHQSEKKDAHQVQFASGLAGRIYRRRGRLCRRPGTAPRRHFSWAGIRHRLPNRSRCCSARGDRGALRRADRLRLQFRRICLRTLQAWSAADSKSQDESRSAYGR